jgi:hypothetical protein
MYVLVEDQLSTSDVYTMYVLVEDQLSTSDVYTMYVLVEDQLVQFLLVFVGLFVYRSIHPFKCPVNLNVTLGLTFDGNIYFFRNTHPL